MGAESSQPSFNPIIPWKALATETAQANTPTPPGKPLDVSAPLAVPLALEDRLKGASWRQLQESQSAYKNKSGSPSLYHRVARHFIKDPWICILARGEKAWIRWIKREAESMEELVKLKRMEERRQRIWSFVKDNFHKELLRIQCNRQEALSQQNRQQ